MSQVQTRSGSQKFLLVVSIIQIIFAILTIILGAILAVGGTAVGTLPASEVADLVQETGLTQSQISSVGTGAGIGIVISGIINLIVGILGIRAANDARKVMPVFILAIIALIGAIISIVYAFTQGGGSSVASAVVTLIIDILMLWIANNIRKQKNAMY